MGLFSKNKKDANFAGGSRNIVESIQRDNDTNTLIYLDCREDFNTNSVITVAPNEQAIFIKNGKFYGMLPSGRHEIKSENFPVLSYIRNMLSGGISTFTCQVYHVSISEQNVNWGTSCPIEIQDYFLGGGAIGVPTLLRGAGEFRVRFNILENDEASKCLFIKLLGDKSSYSVRDLSDLFRAQISQEISSVVGKILEERSKKTSINAISSQLKDFSIELKPYFVQLFRNYGLALIDFSFYNLTIDETDERKKYLDRLIAAAHAGNYDKAVQQEILKDVALNEGSGGIVGAGAGLGMGMMAGKSFGSMLNTSFQTQPSQQSSDTDTVQTLRKLKGYFDEGLIPKDIYEKKVSELMDKL